MTSTVTTEPQSSAGPLGWLLRFPKAVLAGFLILSLGLAWQARHFEIDASAETLLTEGNRLYLQSRVLQQRFPSSEFLLVAYAPHDGQPLAPKHLAVVAELSDQIRKLPRVASVRSVRNVPFVQQAGSLTAAAGLQAEDLSLEGGGVRAEQLPALLEGHPLYENLLISADQQVLALQVSFRTDPELAELEQGITALQAQQLQGPLTSEDQHKLDALKAQRAPLLKALAQQRGEELAQLEAWVQAYADQADIVLGGGQVLGQELIRIVKRDLQIFGAAIAAIIALLVLLLFRQPRWVAICALCCLSSVLASTGLFGLLGLKATVISANYIALQLILTLAIVIHLIVQYRELAQAHSDWSQRALVAETLRQKWAPCFYAGATTSVGFASLLFSGIQPVIAFGWMMIIAMGLSLLVSLLLFPALLLLTARNSPNAAWGQRGLAWVAELCERRPRTVVLVSVGLFAAALAGLPRLSVENSFINYFAEDTQVHQSLSFIDQRLGGTTPLDIVITEAPDQRHLDLVLRAQTLLKLQRLQHELDDLKGVGQQLSLVDFAELARRANAGKPLTEYELTAIFHLLDAELREQLVGSFFSDEHHQLRLSVRIQDATPELNRAELLEEIRAALTPAQLAPEQVQLAGLFVLYQDLLARLFESQVLTLGLVFAVLAVAFLLVFRSLSLALLALVPNVVTSLSILGLMGWLGVALDFMTITIAAIAMGIAVDDTIHYLHRYQDEAANGGATEAVQATHLSVGQALLYTTLIICTGFAMLGFSDFVPSVLFGLLTALAIALALLTDLLLLPALLLLKDRRRQAA